MPDGSENTPPISEQGPGKAPGRRSWTASRIAFSARPTPPSFEALRTEYHALLTEMIVGPPHSRQIQATINAIVASRSRYEDVARQTGVPWYVISTVHNLEASLRFDCHLHNGDPLTARTVDDPAGRPPTGDPPFTWETSAADALKYDGFTANSDWSLEKIAYLLEGYNGWGYRWYHSDVKSPYLWSYSNLYVSGKYDKDGHWNQSLVSDQIGGMVLLRAMRDHGLITESPSSRFARDSLISSELTATISGASDDGARIPALVAMASDQAQLAGAQRIAAKRLLDYDHEIYPTDGCAITQSVLFQLAGIEIPDIFMALEFGNVLRHDRRWQVIAPGTQRPGDVGSTCGTQPRHGVDHVYLVLKSPNPAEVIIADNQDVAPHFRVVAGGGNWSPTTFFLRAG